MRVRIVTVSCTLNDIDCYGTKIICNSASAITLTMPASVTSKNEADSEIDNIGTANVTCCSRTISSQSHAHLVHTGAAWDVVLGGGSETDPVYAASASGGVVKTAYDHSQVTHAPSNAQKNSDIIKSEIEAKLIGTLTSHGHDGAVPSGGTINQIAAKNSATSFDLKWMNAPAAANGLPVGGAINQLPAKNSGTDFDMKWIDVPQAGNGLPPGGSATQILEKIDGTNFNTQWVAKPTGGGSVSIWGGM